jgi:hypothetical protein
VTGYRATNAYWFCGLAAYGTGAEVDAGKVYSDSTFDYHYGNFAAALPGEWAIARVRTSQPIGGDATITCNVDRGGVGGAATYSATTTPGGDVGLRTNGSDTSFDYVFVVAVPRS